MRITVTTALALCLASSSTASAAELVVDVYDGVKECEDSEKVKSGDHVSMHYTGTIDESSETGEKGSKFDSSHDRDQTIDIQIGMGQVIQGWDEGIVGLCKGAKANLIIPPDMGYGEAGAGGVIPGGATLKFDVEVVDISDEAPPQPNMFETIDADKDGKLSKADIEAWFKSQGADEVPEGLWEQEDKDGDGFISWEEFGGPKGDAPPTYASDEL